MNVGVWVWRMVEKGGCGCECGCKCGSESSGGV